MSHRILAVFGLVAALSLGACTATEPGLITTAPTVATSTGVSSTEPGSPTTAGGPTTGQTTATTLPSADGSVPPLFVLGNWGTGTLPEGAVSGAMATRAENGPAPMAILTTGDNLFLDDYEFVLRPFDWATGAGVDFWPSWGEVDVVSPDRIESVETAFDSPPRWTVENWGQVAIVILDSNQAASLPQRSFLQETLDAIDGPTIVVFHHPLMTCTHPDDERADVEAWVPLFDDDVLLVLNGHYANYQRFRQGGVTYLVSGGGGDVIDDLSPCPVGHPSLVVGEAIHHFLILHQDETMLRVEAVNVSGSTIDQFVIPLDAP